MSLLPEWVQKIQFLYPQWFVVLPVILLPYVMDRKNRSKAVTIASIEMMVPWHLVKRPSVLRHGGWFLRSISLALIIFTLARPQLGEHQGRRSSEGIDIMLAIDTSGSMRARDFEVQGKRPDRLEVIKAVISHFIEARPEDRIGMVVFGSEAYTQAPLTLDHAVLLRFLEKVEIGMAGDGTAIGDGLANAVKRIKDTLGKSHVIVLLTDGANNSGRIDPLAAAQAAKALNIRVHTIGVGSEGMVPIVQNGRVYHIKADIDEKTLTAIAQETGGIYRRAVDTDALVNVYNEIDKLEKVKREEKEQHRGRDVFGLILPWVLLFLFMEIAWRATKYRRVPA